MGSRILIASLLIVTLLSAGKLIQASVEPLPVGALQAAEAIEVSDLRFGGRTRNNDLMAKYTIRNRTPEMLYADVSKETMVPESNGSQVLAPRDVLQPQQTLQLPDSEADVIVIRPNEFVEVAQKVFCLEKNRAASVISSADKA